MPNPHGGSPQTAPRATNTELARFTHHIHRMNEKTRLPITIAEPELRPRVNRLDGNFRNITVLWTTRLNTTTTEKTTC